VFISLYIVAQQKLSVYLAASNPSKPRVVIHITQPEVKVTSASAHCAGIEGPYCMRRPEVGDTTSTKLVPGLVDRPSAERRRQFVTQIPSASVHQEERLLATSVHTFYGFCFRNKQY